MSEKSRRDIGFFNDDLHLRIEIASDPADRLVNIRVKLFLSKHVFRILGVNLSYPVAVFTLLFFEPFLLSFFGKLGFGSSIFGRGGMTICSGVGAV